MEKLCSINRNKCNLLDILNCGDNYLGMHLYILKLSSEIEESHEDMTIVSIEIKNVVL
jgi:hypothetical protein